MPTDPAAIMYAQVGIAPKQGTPATLKLTGGRRQMLASWLDDDAATTETPAVPVTPTPAPPPVVTPPSLPALERHVATPGAQRGIFWERNGPGIRSLSDCHVEGYSSNLSVQRADSLTLSNVRSLRAWRDDPTPTDAKTYLGQGLYIRDIHGPVRIKGQFGGWNGWQPGKPFENRTMYRHAGIYADFNTPDIVIEDFVWVGAPACGGQFRAGGTLRNGVILDCGIGVLASMGNLTLENVTVYSGNYYWTKDKNGPAWTGMAGVAAYWPVNLKSDVWIVGKPDQASGDATVKASGIVRKYPGPAVQLNRQAGDKAHPEWKQPPAGVPLVTVGPGCVVAGWPLNPQSPTTFGGSGMTPAAAAELAKIRVLPTPVRYDYSGVLADLEANRLSIADAVKAVRDGVRSLVQ